MDWESATRFEVELGRATLASGEAREGAARFASGEGRHGAF
jgi:enoyl-CoA hydratase